jgi:hypothetical protein
MTLPMTKLRCACTNLMVGGGSQQLVGRPASRIGPHGPTTWRFTNLSNVQPGTRRHPRKSWDDLVSAIVLTFQRPKYGTTLMSSQLRVPRMAAWRRPTKKMNAYRRWVNGCGDIVPHHKMHNAHTGTLPHSDWLAALSRTPRSRHSRTITSLIMQLASLHRPGHSGCIGG